MSKFNSSQNIGEIVVEFPKAADVFKAYKIDFCCGGNRPLITAIEEQGFDETEVLDRLNELYKKFAEDLEANDKDWREASTEEIVEQILYKHHAYLWAELPKIGRLVITILKVHGANHPELSKVHRLFNTVNIELESHLVKEETIQYPAIREYLDSNDEADLDKAIKIIDELKEEHAGAGNIMKELRIVTDDYKIPSDVCVTFESTYAKLQEMEDDLFQHIHLENNVLFPRLLRLKNAKKSNGG